ncbi:MAG: Hpt domain-containing protein [Thermoguttaceae bacterium]|nr:Hpt domain-containing protein [Thermoguttaceae bacterium]MDW8078000.1 Hpt domain-containing protein [Thermoguttaceae bacterium]
MATVVNWQYSGATGVADPIYSPLASDPGLRDLLELFAATLPQRLQNLERLADEGDWEGLRRQAHQLKGAAGSYGFAPLSVTAAQLETIARQNPDPEKIRQLLDQLRDLASRVTTESPGI